MRIRVIRCPEDAHPLPWVKAGDCDHWSRKCPRGGKHKLKRGEPGYLVQPYPYTEVKRYLGFWAGPDGSTWVPALRGDLIHCTGCDLKGAA